MRVLSVVGKAYYGRPNTVEPMYLAFTDPIRELGHTVDHFDHMALGREMPAAEWGEKFVRAVRDGGYDLVLFQTASQTAEEINTWVSEAGRYAPIVAWNSDDEWTWKIQTEAMAPAFTFMVTLAPTVYAENKARFPNLRLSQWGCYDRFANHQTHKDLEFTFAGQVYGERVPSCRVLRRTADLQVFGFMSGRVHFPPFLFWPVIRKVTHRFPALYGRAISYEQINEIWNRSRISYTPMESSRVSSILQIKSRTFEMGLSGTLMLCNRSPNLELYYDEGTEYVGFDSLQECADKARYYLAHEAERARIADAYRRRTLAEHLWRHRFAALFADIGVGRTARVVS